MDHCGIGEGPGIRGAGYDPLTALERWVEQEEASIRVPISSMSWKANT